MRIAFFSDNFYPELTGISDSILITGRELAKRGHTVCYTAPRYAPKNYAVIKAEGVHGQGAFEEYEVDGMPVFRLPSLGMSNSPTGQSRIVIPRGMSLPFMRKFKPDIIHTQSPFGAGIEALLAARVLHVPLVGTNHTPIEEFVGYSPIAGHSLQNTARRFYSWYYNRCLFTTTPYAALIADMRAKGFKGQAKALPNPVDLPLFTLPSAAEKAEMKQALDLRGPTLLYCGRLAAEKHVDHIIEAVAKLIPEFPTMELVITGHGAEDANLRSLVLMRGIENNIRFTGFIPTKDLVRYYKASDAFIIMSTADSQSIALMQAFAAGIPAIGARARGLPDYLPPECGFLVEPGNVDECAARIRDILLDIPMRERMGKAGAAFVKKFSPENIAKSWEEIYMRFSSSFSSSASSFSSRKSRARIKRVSA